MNNSALSTSNLGKLYKIGAANQAYRTLRESVRDAVIQGVPRALSVVRGTTWRNPQKNFWAIRNLSLDIKQGEIVGIIGRNGAGKSTLLKLISRITEPTEGEIRYRGRIGALLEVGTGFHPELTGRDNIFLNGVLLGMSRADVKRQFDAIVEFSGVCEFLDTAVKHYSSGMYMRLAFAVAAHLNPSILIIDEVLAVGDLRFQKKCMDKMGEVASQNRTILFVSHNMAMVRSLCTRGILLHEGRIAYDGPAKQAAAAYTEMFSQGSDVSQQGLSDRLNRTKGYVQISKFELRSSEGRAAWAYEPGETMTLGLICRVKTKVPSLGVYVAVSTADNVVITSMKGVVSQVALGIGDTVGFEIVCPDLTLRPGEYKLYIAIGNDDCTEFYDVIDSNIGMPNLTITSDESDIHCLAGCFSMPWHLRLNSEVT